MSISLKRLVRSTILNNNLNLRELRVIFFIYDKICTYEDYKRPILTSEFISELNMNRQGLYQIMKSLIKKGALIRVQTEKKGVCFYKIVDQFF